LYDRSCPMAKITTIQTQNKYYTNWTCKCKPSNSLENGRSGLCFRKGGIFAVVFCPGIGRPEGYSVLYCLCPRALMLARSLLLCTKIILVQVGM